MLMEQIVKKREMAAGIIEKARKALDGVGEGETPDAEVTALVQGFYDEALGIQSEIKAIEAQLKLAEGVDEMYAFYHTPAGEVPPMATPGAQKGEIKSVGQRFVETRAFKGLAPYADSRAKISGVPAAMPHLFKTLLTGLSSTSAGAFVVDERLPLFVDRRLRPLVMRDLVAPGTTGSDTVEYVRETSFTNAAVPVAEATSTSTGTKPESGLAFEVVSDTVKTIAHWIPATRRALADAGQIRSLVDSRLRMGLELALDDQMCNGDGTGANFTGILNTTGILVQAIGSDTRMDAMKKAMTKVALPPASSGGGVAATAHLMNPLDLDEILLAKDTTGNYIIGDPATRQGGGQVYLWGLPVVPSTVIAQGSALVGSWMLAAFLWDREVATITATDSHSDWFIKNIVAILAEMRMAFGVVRPAGFCEVTFT